MEKKKKGSFEIQDIVKAREKRVGAKRGLGDPYYIIEDIIAGEYVSQIHEDKQYKNIFLKDIEKAFRFDTSEEAEKCSFEDDQEERLCVILKIFHLRG